MIRRGSLKVADRSRMLERLESRLNLAIESQAFVADILGTTADAVEVADWTDGNVMVAWTSSDNTKASFTIVNLSTGAASAPTEIVDLSGGAARVGAISMAAAYPIAVVAWEEIDGGDTDVYVRGFDDNTGFLNTAKRAHASTLAPQDSPAVAILSDGTSMVAWRQQGSSPDSIARVIYGDGMGELVSESAMTVSGDASKPSAGATSNGFVLAWQEDRGGLEQSDVVRSFIASNGNVTITPTRVTVQHRTNQTEARVIGSDSSVHHVAWYDELGDVWKARRFDGSSAGSTFDLSELSFGPDHGSAAIDYDSTYDLFAAAVPIAPSAGGTYTYLGMAVDDRHASVERELASFTGVQSIEAEAVRLVPESGRADGRGEQVVIYREISTGTVHLIRYRRVLDIAATGEPANISGTRSGNDITIAQQGRVTLHAGEAYAAIRVTGTAANDVLNLSLPDQTGTSLAAPASIVYGSGGSDMITTGDAADTIFGDNGADVITSGGGNDSIEGGVGDDTIDAGDGNDYVLGGADVDSILGGEGRDTLTGSSQPNFIDGGPGDDRLTGGSREDTLLGGTGNDRLYGLAGRDVLNGQGNSDRIWGGDGDDLLIGGSGIDRLLGEAGNDQLRGDANADILDGGADTDTRLDTDETDTLISIEI